MNAPVCPVCEDDENISKVSAIHRAQAYGSIGSELARLLAPPGEESYDGRWAMPVAVILAVLWLPVLMLGLPGFYLLGFIWVPAWIGWQIGRHFRDREGEARVRERNTARRERWENAYYCRKHDVVFLPGQSETYPPTDLKRLLGE